METPECCVKPLVCKLSSQSTTQATKDKCTEYSKENANTGSTHRKYSEQSRTKNVTNMKYKYLARDALLSH